MDEIKERIQQVRAAISRAAAAAGKRAEDITLVAVTKTVPVPIINQVIELGIRDIGENRIQEARSKLPELRDGARRHMIGHLQRNKVKYAVKLFDMIQSVDNITLAEELNARCVKMGIQMPILIEVNTSGEDSKIGCQPREALTLLKAVDRLPGLMARGFMTVALFSRDIEQVRPCFKQLRGIFEEARQLPLMHAHIETLSMGMSGDFETAIEEGATMVRVGSAIFGERPPTAG